MHGHHGKKCQQTGTTHQRLGLDQATQLAVHGPQHDQRRDEERQAEQRPNHGQAAGTPRSSRYQLLQPVTQIVLAAASTRAAS